MPLISIIIPIYNSESTLRCCFDSVLSQTYTNIEVIAVDDGSTDSSGAICDEYARNDYRVRVIHQQNSGLVIANRIALKAAQGDYVGFADSDDYVEPDMYERLLAKLIADGADYIHSQFYARSGRYRQYPEFIDISADRIGFMSEHVLDIDYRMIASKCTNLYKVGLIRKAYDHIRNDFHWAEDAAIMIATAAIADRISFLNDGFYHYVVHSDSESRSADLGKFREASAWYEDMKSLLKNLSLYDALGSKLDEYYKTHILSIVMSCFGEDLIMTNWIIPTPSNLVNKRIVLFGGGGIGRSFHAYLLTKGICEIVAWVDTRHEAYGDDVRPPECIPSLEYDAVLIAVKDEAVKSDIEDSLIHKYGVLPDRILWEKPRSVCRN